MRTFMNTILFSAVLFGITSTTFAAAAADKPVEDAAFAALMAAVPNQFGNDEVFKARCTIIDMGKLKIVGTEYDKLTAICSDATNATKKCETSQAFIAACAAKLYVPGPDAEMFAYDWVILKLEEYLPILGAQGLAVFTDQAAKYLTPDMSNEKRGRSVLEFSVSVFSCFEAPPIAATYEDRVSVLKALGDLQSEVSNEDTLLNFVCCVLNCGRIGSSVEQRIEALKLFTTQVDRILSLYPLKDRVPMMRYVRDTLGKAIKNRPLKELPGIVETIINAGPKLDDIFSSLRSLCDSLDEDCVMEEDAAEVPAAAGAGGGASARAS